MASGHSGGVSNDTGQLAGDTALRDAPERGLESPWRGIRQEEKQKAMGAEAGPGEGASERAKIGV